MGSRRRRARPKDERGALVSPTGTLALARRYLDGAEVLIGGDLLVAPHYPVPYYLLGHSIELALKALLACRRWTDDQLRQLGHDLDACLEAADREGLRDCVGLSDDERVAIAMVNVLYDKKELEYSMITPGNPRLLSVPNQAYLQSAANKLIAGLRDPCRRALREMLGR